MKGVEPWLLTAQALVRCKKGIPLAKWLRYWPCQATDRLMVRRSINDSLASAGGGMPLFKAMNACSPVRLAGNHHGQLHRSCTGAVRFPRQLACRPSGSAEIFTGTDECNPAFCGEEGQANPACARNRPSTGGQNTSEECSQSDCGLVKALSRVRARSHGQLMLRAHTLLFLLPAHPVIVATPIALLQTLGSSCVLRLVSAAIWHGVRSDRNRPLGDFADTWPGVI